jgi:hypothetical protein
MYSLDECKDTFKRGTLREPNTKLHWQKADKKQREETE